MADPFEVRMRFTTQLQHLSASVTSAQKAAHYALKYRDMDEDLHSCILEQLERNSMNNRANIMYFIEHLCELATKENHLEFVRMMRRDILRVVDAVVPSDGSGAANVKHVRRVLNGLQSKSVLSTETVDEIDACLKERDNYPEDLLESKAPEGGDENNNADEAAAAAAARGDILKAGSSAKIKVDRRQIEQRIEEDRERNKRLREIIWTVPSHDKGEVDKVWDDLSDIGEDDFLQTSEEAQERLQAAEAATVRT